MKQLTEDMKWLCREYQDHCTEVERREEGIRVRQELEVLYREIRGKFSISKPELLLALLDAYEITRDEAMLQEVLDVVSRNLGQLKVSADAVKLLAYCWYYVEEEECVVRAREMLEELKRRGKDVAEAEKVLEELTENF